MDELTKEFLAESLEGLDRMDQCLTELEMRPRDAELLGEIFRAVHTIKGTTGFLGFGRLEKLAHAGENLLGSLRDGRLDADEQLVSGLLQLTDRLRAILRLIEKTGKEGSRACDDDGELIALMERLNSGENARADAPVKLALVVEGEIEGAETLKAAEVRTVPAAAAGAASTLNEKTLRIDVDVLNRMMNLVGELVLTRNQMLQSNVDAANFPELARRLDSVTADLREAVMQARMQPVGHLFSKFPRLVRDLARSCEKQVRIEFSGQETGLDKSLLEAIKDPLTHAVRNAVDHGLEDAAGRRAASKPVEGVVTLRAFHQSGSVVIEVEDDGGGIATERVLAKAVERRLISEEQAAGMSAREALQLIFLPGFSTASKVTTVSGRGVGMDVVRANVEKVGGTVEVDSHEGKGTVLRLRVPLTLAIVPALVVRSGGQSFCLPQGSLAELVYVPRREAETSVERMGEAELFRLRDTLLPMIWLDELLRLNGEGDTREEHGFYLAVLEAEGCRFGLVVDDLLAPEEIVVKPLSGVLREVGLFSGATVLGNGMLAMILDVAATAIRAGVKPLTERAASRRNEAYVETGAEGAQEAFLVFEGGGRAAERMALPMAAVERIESVPACEVEYAAGRPVLQYRGELLPLEDAGGILDDERQRDGDGCVTVLICSGKMRQQNAEEGFGGDRRSGDRRSPKRIGLVVTRVLDVASGSLLDDDVEICTERLAMVKERLTVIHGGFEGARVWKEVA